MVTREEITRCLEIDWDAYLAQFNALPDGGKKEFLLRQGYPSFAALLAHLTAWWQVGMQVIRHHQSDPDYHHPQMDVDAFNQAVIDSVSGLSDAVVIAEFKAASQELLDFVNNLSDADLANPKINLQLLIEVIEHLEEHQ